MPSAPASPVITRFAPSPTGFLHIGGARTALFNWLFAKHYGGTMLLRIEDTDRERSTQAAIDAIIEGLSWLGLLWDGEPIYQFSRAERHRAVAEELLAKGLAYHCYATPDELTEMREAARAANQPIRYDGRWRDRDSGDAPKDIKPVIRLKAPQTGETVVDDRVQGRVTWQNEHLDDLVLLRSDGTPTYMLAVVVDDHDMNVTHIIRGDDHFTNAARQTQIYQALGWEVPVMAHIPLIHGADGAKLSKRHGALGVETYRAMGYLPEAMQNYLLRLGWSHGDQEFFTPDERIAHFDGTHINKAPARFDLAKLDHVNGHVMRGLSDDALLEALGDLAQNLTPAHEARLKILLPALRERAKTLLDILKGADFLFQQSPIALEPSAEALLTSEAKTLLNGLANTLEALPFWDSAALEACVRDLVKNKNLKFPQLAQPLRAALTGRTNAPAVFDLLLALGKEESLLRLRA
jgi:glutamyl-tRNA synthetase